MTPEQTQQFLGQIGMPWDTELVKAAWVKVLEPWDFPAALTRAQDLLTVKSPKNIVPADFGVNGAVEEWRVHWPKIETMLARGQRAEVRAIAARRKTRAQIACDSIAPHIWHRGERDSIMFAFRDAFNALPPEGAPAAVGVIGTGQAALPAGDRLPADDLMAEYKKRQPDFDPERHRRRATKRGRSMTDLDLSMDRATETSGKPGETHPCCVETKTEPGSATPTGRTAENSK